MARRKFSITQAAISTGTALKTLMQVTAVSACVALLELEISFAGTSNTATPILVELLVQTTAGTMSALTPRLIDTGVTYTILATAQHTATAEPTASNILKQWYVHPQTGFILPSSDVGEIVIAAGNRMGLRVTAAADVQAVPYMVFEE